MSESFIDLVLNSTDFKIRINQWKINTKITDNNCWIFLGSRTTEGYGQVRINGKLYLLHRISALFYLGLDFNSDKQALHKPVICKSKGCWNPEHLYIGTASDNTKDQVIDNVHNNSSKLFCKRKHELNKVGWYSRGNTRICKECQRIKNSIKNKYSRNRRIHEW